MQALLSQYVPHRLAQLSLIMPLLVLGACQPDYNPDAKNDDPEAVLSSPTDGTTLLEGESLNLTGTVTDRQLLTEADGMSSLNVSWFAGTEQICSDSTPDVDGNVSCAWIATAGVSELRLQVVDRDGAEAEDHASITVTASEAPTVSILAPTDANELYSDLTFLVEAQILDTESAAADLVLSWSSNVDGALNVVGNTDANGHFEGSLTLSQGQHTLTATVTDPGGKTGIDSQILTIFGPNTPPTCAFSAPAATSSFAIGETVTFMATVGDAETAPQLLDVQLSSDISGDWPNTISPDSNGNIIVNWSDLLPGTQTITLNVSDSRDEPAVCNLPITICEGTWYQDVDGDDHGDPNVVIYACEAPAGYVSRGDDCNDLDINTYPGAAENESLQDCMQDQDLDGFGDMTPAIGISPGSDCDDNDDLINPDATEVCDGQDNDCDGVSDGANADGASLYYADSDGDYYGNSHVSILDCSAPAGYVADNTDCDDTTTNAHPGAIERCDNIDNNCDNNIDEGVTSTFYADNDGDSYGRASSSLSACSAPAGYVNDASDCDDNTASTHPNASESCDGIDNNCNNVIDEGVTSTFYVDADGDNFGRATSSITACSAPSGYVSNADDCNDYNVSINPAITEICNGGDDNCDGLVDDADPFLDCNQPPSITAASMSPDPAFAGDYLVCTGVGWTDADGDSEGYTFVWTVNGSSQAETGDTLVGSFVRGDTIRCTATPFDGIDSGTARSTSLIISNTAPTAPVVSISPLAPNAGENDLICELSHSAVDVDGDTINYDVQWYVDGTPFTGTTTTTLTGDTVPLENAYEGETWLCSITASDNFDTGGSDSDSVVMGPSNHDGLLSVTAGTSCTQIEADYPDSYNADYWIYPNGDTSQTPHLEACIFDNHVTTFSYTGAVQTWTVPDGVGYVTVKAWGAGGGGTFSSNGCGASDRNGGAGGASTATSAVNAGDSLLVTVGKGGYNGSYRPLGSGSFTAGADPGWMGGGGQGAPQDTRCGAYGGGSGGGYSGVFWGTVSQSDALVMAGGGGGAGTCQSAGAGGGSTGSSASGGSGNGPGVGGTQSAGGSRGGATTVCQNNGNATGGSGAALYGGSGCYAGYFSNGGAGGSGGGGGGYFGGGGGGEASPGNNCGSGGGGGSGYYDASSSNAQMEGASGTSVGGTAWTDYASPAGRAGTSANSYTGDNGYVVIRY